MKIIANQITAKAERRQFDGREFLVAPTVAIVEGVMNNILYTQEEMTRFIEVWNGKPLPLSHPTDQAGNHISANSPDQHAKSLGFFFNAKFEDSKLKGEWWIDTEKAKALGVQANEVLKRLEAGEMVEQSTGLFLDIEPSEGVFNNKTYTGIARNIRPDHVAILLNEEGACSIADGCGTPRVNSDQGENNGNIATWIINKIEALFNNHTEQIAMKDKQERIEAIVANEKCPFDAEYLANASDEQLNKLEALLATNEPASTPDPEPIEGDEPTDDNVLPAEAVAFMSMVEELGGVDAVKDTLNGLKANSDQERTDLIAQIVANTSFTEDELSGNDIAFLRKMAEQSKPAPTAMHLRPMPVSNVQSDEWEDYVAPEAALNGKGGE